MPLIEPDMSEDLRLGYHQDTLENLRLDYQQTNEYIKLLTDIRFRLLVFTPVITGITFAFSEFMLNRNGTIFIVGILGFVATLGIIIYDQRNSQLYNRAIQRATRLEQLLEFPPIMKDNAHGGLFYERPARKKELLGLILIWHDRGLALVYGASICGWSFLIIDSFSNIFLTATNITKMLSVLISTEMLAVILSGIVGLLFIYDLHRLDYYNLIKNAQINIYQLINKILPEKAWPWYKKGNYLKDIKRYEDALDAYETALHINKHHAKALKAKGELLNEMHSSHESG